MCPMEKVTRLGCVYTKARVDYMGLAVELNFLGNLGEWLDGIKHLIVCSNSFSGLKVFGERLERL
jgi:hypothetical protein